jgi:hypothetical protein
MLAAAGTDPTLSVHGWLATAIALGALATASVAAVAFMTKVMLPMITAVAEMRRDYPVWVKIAEKFGSAGGETISTELRALASNDEVASANQRAMMAQLETVITQQKTLDARVGSLDEKLKDTRHSIIGAYATLEMSAAGSRTLVDAIVKTSEDLQAVRVELGKLTPPDPKPEETLRAEDQ